MSVVWHGDKVMATLNQVSKDNTLRACFLVQGAATRDVNVDTGRHRASLSVAVSFQNIGRASVEVKLWTGKPKDGRPPNEQMSTSEDGVEKPGAGRGEYTGAVGSNVEYAIYRELEKASLRKALEENATAIEKLFNKGL